MRRISFIFIAVLNVLVGTAMAAPNGLYFMDILPYQAYQNPALQPLSNSYVEIPGISTISASVGTGGVSLSDIMYVKDGQLVTFLHPEYGSKDALFAKLQNPSLLTTDVDVSLLGFGFRIGPRGYFTFNTSLRVDALVGLPKDLFALGFYGMPDTLGVNRYDLGSTRMDVRSYLDIAGGYSHRINEKWTVGGRLHVLVGLAAAQTQFDNLVLEASADEWKLSGQGRMRLSMPGIAVATDEQGHITNVGFYEDAMDVLMAYKPSMGAAIDLGVSYRPVPELNLSLSVKDIGFMYWNNLNTGKVDMEGYYDGVYFQPGEPTNIVDSLAACIKGSMVLDNSDKGYVQELRGKLYVGAEYSFLRNMMSVGVLSKTEFMTNYVSEEISLNYKIRPCHWFGISAGYSFFSGGWSTMGLALDLKLPPFNFYVATDYTPLYYGANGVPYRSQAVNVQAGVVLTFKTKANARRLMQKVEIPVDSTKMAADTLMAMEALAVPADTLMVMDSLALPVDSVLMADSLAMPVDSVLMVDSLVMPLDTAAVLDSLALPVDSVLATDSLTLPVDTVVLTDSLALSIQEQWEALVAEAGQDASSSTQVVTETVTTQEVDANELSGTNVVRMSDGKKED
jgi:hypothetical protein